MTEDRCRPVTVPVDGQDETILVHGVGEFTAKDRDALGELVAATKRLLASDHWLAERQKLTVARLHAFVALPEGETKQRLRVAVDDALSALTEAATVRQVLAELVRLKDGPRDDAYRSTNDAAWQRARDLLSEEQA